MASVAYYDDKNTIIICRSSTDEGWGTTLLQIGLPFLVAGLGMVAAGLVLDEVQHWPVFLEVPELFILVPALLGLKVWGNNHLDAIFILWPSHVDCEVMLCALSCVANVNIRRNWSLNLCNSLSLVLFGRSSISKPLFMSKSLKLSVGHKSAIFPKRNILRRQYTIKI